jgi:hypothetical protein
MATNLERQRRYADLREQATAGATAATFAGYEALHREARAAGDEALARRCLRDLAELTSLLDPEVGRKLAAAAGPDPRGERELTVVVVGAPEAAGDVPALRALAEQTIAPERVETIVSDSGGPAARNEALRAASGRIVAFVDADVAPARDALERIVAAHGDAAAPPRVVVGRVELSGLEREPLARLLIQLRIEGALTGFDRPGAIAGELCDSSFFSAPRAELVRAGGFDAELVRCDGADLGVRLERAGFAAWFEPAIRATRAASGDLDAWLERARALGADWFHLSAKHGAAAPPSFLRDVGLDAGATESLVARLLAGADAHARCTTSLRESLREFARIVAARPAEADGLFVKVVDDFTSLLLRVTRHELTRGFVNRAQGSPRAALERCATNVKRGAAVLVLRDESLLPAVEVVLQNLPADGVLVVAAPDGAPLSRLPDDPRIARMAIPRQPTPEQLRRGLLAATDADFLVLLDGTLAPTRNDWEAMRLTLATLPLIGACSVDGETGEALATAQLSSHLPDALIALRRDAVESDPGEAGPLLTRLVRRGYRLATAKAGLAECS